MAQTVGMKLALEGEAQYKAGLQQIQQKSKELASEMKAVVSAGEGQEKQMEVLSKQISNQKNLIDQLNKKYESQKKDIDDTKKAIEDAKKAYGENSSEVQKLETQLLKQETALSKTKTQINNETDSLNKMEKAEEDAAKDADTLGKETEEAGEEAKKAGNDGFTVFKGIVANLATDALKMAVQGLKNLANGIKEAVSETAAYGEEVDKASQKLGLSAETYQQLKYAMEMSGADIESFKKGMLNMNDALAEVAAGNEEAGETFQRLGVKMKKPNGQIKTSEELLLDTIDALAGMEDATQRDAVAQEIFGKKMTELRPLLNGGADSVRELMQEAKDYGMVMSDDAVAASADFDDAMQRLQGTTQGLKRSFVSELLPGLTQVMDGFSKMVAGKGGVEDLRKGIIDTIGAITKKTPEFVKIGKEILTSIIRGFTENFGDIVDGLTSIVPDIFDAIADLITEIDIGQLVTSVFDCINSIIKAIVPRLPELLVQLVAGIIKALPELFVGVGETIFNIFNGLFGGYTEFDEMKGVLDRQSEAWNAVTDSMATTVDQIETDAGTWQDQWDMLKSITDEDGKVKDGYHGIAQVLVDELNQELGTNIQLVKGQIQDYKDLQTEIDNLIEKKRAELILQAEEEAYAEALRMRPELVQAVTDAENGLKRAQEELTQAQSDYDALVESGADLTGAQTRIDNAKRGLSDMQSALDEATANLRSNTQVQTQYMNDYAAIMKKDYNSIGTTTSKYTGQTKADLEAYSQSLATQLQQDQTNLDAWVAELDRSYSDQAKAQVDYYSKRVETDKTNIAAINELIEKGGEDFSTGYVNGILSGESKVDSAAKTITDKALNGVRNTQQSQSPSRVTDGLGQDFGQGYANGIGAMDGTVSGKASGLASTATGQLSSYNDAYSAGKSTGTGFADGIGAMADYVWSSARSIASNALSSIKKALGIASPSKETMWLGEMMGEGLALGIKDSTRDAVDAMRGMAGSVMGVGFGTPQVPGRMPGAVSNSYSMPITVYGAPGQDVNELAEIVIDKMQMQIIGSEAVYA